MSGNNITIKSHIAFISRIIEPMYRQVVANALREARGDWAVASALLKDKLPPELLQKLDIADLVATAVGDKPEVAKAILSQLDIKTQRDLAKLNVNNLIKRIAPNAKPDTKKYQQANKHAMSINNQSFVREPLTVLQRMTIDKELPIADEKVRSGLGTFLQCIPAETDIWLTPIHKVLTEDALKDVPEEQRAAVVEHAKILWNIMAITPHDAPHVPQILMNRNLTSALQISEIRESAFLWMCGKEMGESTARHVYTNAINTRIKNNNALIAMRDAIRGTGLGAIDDAKTIGALGTTIDKQISRKRRAIGSTRNNK
jgi:hypothetical protein